MNVTALSNSIHSLVVEMKDITLEAGVPAHTFNQILEVDQELTFEDLENRLEFLTATRQKQYQAVLEIWRLLPPLIWLRYEQFGETQLREQKLLKEARYQLRRVWRKRYGEKEPVPEQVLDSQIAAGERV